MEPRFCFGIGCYHFGIGKSLPYDFSVSDYLEKLEETLRSISNIDNISINADDIFSQPSCRIEDEPLTIDDGPGYFPHLNDLRIEFDIYIPFRVQNELVPWEHYLPSTYAEKFHITLLDSYHFPVTFVECLDAPEDCSPSEAVIIVRKFLEREIEKNNSDFIRFESLGPSPFHVDCYVEPASTSDIKSRQEEISSKRVPMLGYDKLTFYYNVENITSPKQILDKVYREILDELGLYYWIVQIRSVRMGAWDEVEGMLNELLALKKKGGMNGWWQRLINSGAKIDNGIVNLIEFESQGIINENLVSLACRDIYSDAKQKHFDTFIDHERTDRIEYPIEQSNRLMALFERRRIKGLEMGALLLASVLGGVVGALLTITLSAPAGP